MKLRFDVRDRRYRHKKYRQCFIASEAVSSIMSAFKLPDRQTAVNVGDQLRRMGVFEHVVYRKKRFSDKYLFFRFVPEEDGSRPSPRRSKSTSHRRSTIRPPKVLLDTVTSNVHDILSSRSESSTHASTKSSSSSHDFANSSQWDIYTESDVLRPPDQWEVENVCAWLKTLDLPASRVDATLNAFKDNDIDGELLLKLENADLIEAGISSMGVRRKIVAVIERLNETSKSFPDPIEGENVQCVDFEKHSVEIHERLGGGGSGARVYRSSINGFSFATKILDASLSDHDQIRAIEKEISLISQLRHENIVRFLGSKFDVEDKKIYLYMSLYSGDLSDVISDRVATNAPFSPKEVCVIMSHIANGLNHLHSQTPAVVHRDLKTENVFVNKDAQNNLLHLCIGDFDVAKQVNASGKAFTQAVGTPGYIAPEMFGDQSSPDYKGHTPAADIWSFGMILFHVITMAPPYSDLSPFAVSRACASGDRPTLPENIASDSMWDPLVDIHRRCTNRAPEKRPNAKELFVDLMKLQKEE